STYHIESNGALTLINSIPAGLPFSDRIAVDPSGNFVYTIAPANGGFITSTLLAYRIASDGTLVPIASFATQDASSVAANGAFVFTGSSDGPLVGIATDKKFVYALNNSIFSTNISVYKVASNGLLTFTGRSPSPVGNTISVFRIGPHGTLQPVP